MISQHPDFNAGDYEKWRLAYEGGRPFVDKYLEKFSIRETDTEFVARRRLSYCPRFAGAGIDDIKNGIYQRIVDVSRIGGTESYQKAISGNIDLAGNSMNSFMGCSVLLELLIMGQVGIYVDMPPVDENTLYINQPRPYVYIYKREDIRNWVKDPTNPNKYQSVLLRDRVYEVDDLGFPEDIITRYRHLWMQDGRVRVRILNEEMEPISNVDLNLSTIPFIGVEITNSLMDSIADYQIALLNIASSDLYYTLKSNFPFYTEQYDPATLISPYLKPEGEDQPKDREVTVGITTGRAYPVGTERPRFIAPPSEPLRSSMAKQEQLKEEIRLLLNLAITNLRPQRTSAESKRIDETSLEAGLSYIGLTLETAERTIAEVWNQYENQNVPVTIKYPKEYSLKTDSERREEAQELDDLRLKIPSITYQKEISRIIANILLSHKVGREVLELIEYEIESAPCVTGDPQSIREDVEAGILDIELASRLRLYPEGTAEKAKRDHAERLARIKDSQTSGARGTETEQLTGKLEKEAARSV